ncbi:NmrA family NAD(P)-binding protein [Nocardia australiensis]|uniref:NmrA family NAD(P)-binding protein n=1 Tax=Nocardia australiensis TaxID=2887191 RepID=UPI001D13A5FB|nr:NmrA family NAD(P)-binding protein [Nocardia australiensis]
MDARNVLVTGATGKTGSRVAAGLRQRGSTVRAASRAAEPPFDWGDRSTWAAALTDVDAVYLATPITAQVRAGEQGEVGFGAAAVAEFVELAVSRGVRRLVLLSGRSARAQPVHPHMVALEQPVRNSGVEWTILSPGVFHQNFLTGPLRDGIMAGRVERVEADLDPVLDFTDVTDIADVAVEVLTTPGHGGAVYELSGPRALSHREAVGIIGRTLGRDISYERITLDEWVVRARERGLGNESIEFLTVSVRGHAGGAYSTPFDGIQRVLGRAPRSFESFVREAVATGAWASRPAMSPG